jgi:hypothetical protein
MVPVWTCKTPAPPVSLASLGGSQRLLCGTRHPPPPCITSPPLPPPCISQSLIRIFSTQLCRSQGRCTHGNRPAPHTSHVTRHMSHVTRHTSHVTRHTSHVARHTSHVTRHTSHVTRHTSHFTRHTSQVIDQRLGEDFTSFQLGAPPRAHYTRCSVGHVTSFTLQSPGWL